jgi:hypothetical protein
MGKMGGGKTFQNQLVSKKCRQHYWRIKLAFVFVVILGMGNTNDLFAQFQPASLPEMNYGPSMIPRNTGTDIYTTSSGDIYNVSAYGSPTNSNAGISYNVRTSTLSINNSIKFSKPDAEKVDVCLVHNASGRVFALAVYEAQNRFYLEVFRWNGTSFISISNTLFYSVGGTTNFSYPNIDGDSNGNFVIVLDDQSYVYAFTGTFVSGHPALNNLTPLFLDKGDDPDVSLFDGSNPIRVHIAYAEPRVPSITISDYDLPTLVALSDNTVSFVGIGLRNFGTYNTMRPTYPRIASPTAAFGGPDDFTVVYLEDEYVDPISRPLPERYIVGYNQTNGVPLFQTYNDGSGIFAPFGLQNLNNYFPVVTYNSIGDLYIGWNFLDNDPTNIRVALNANHCIVFRLPINGAITGNDCWLVSNGAFSGVSNDLLSIAGRFTEVGNGYDGISLTYCNQSSNEIVSKIAIPNPTSSLKIANSIKIENSDFENNELIIVEKYNLLGKLEAVKSCTYQEFLITSNNDVDRKQIAIFKLRSQLSSKTKIVKQFVN